MPNGGDPLRAVAEAVWHRLGKDAKAGLLRATAAGLVHYGHNVHVVMPSGPAANEVRRATPDLLAAGAILRMGGPAGEPRWGGNGDGLSFLARHVFVDFLLQGTTEGRKFAAAESSFRLTSVARRLHSVLVRQFPPHASGTARIVLRDAVSATDVGATAWVGEGKAAIRVRGFSLDRSALTMVRGVIAPRNQPSAEVTLTFPLRRAGTISMRVNSFCISAPVPACAEQGNAAMLAG